MGFTIVPELANTFNTFNMIQLNGISYLWGALLALVIVLIVSTESYHMRITALPTLLMLNAIGIYQHIVVMVIAIMMFVTATLTFKILKGGLESIQGIGTAIGTSVSNAKMGSLSYGALKYGGYANAKLMQSKNQELKDADKLIQLNKYKNSDISKLNPYELKQLGLTKSEINMINKLSTLKKKDKIELDDLERKNKPYSENLTRQEQMLKDKTELARLTSLGMTTNRKHQLKMAKIYQKMQDGKNVSQKESAEFWKSYNDAKMNADKESQGFWNSYNQQKASQDRHGRKFWKGYSKQKRNADKESRGFWNTYNDIKMNANLNSQSFWNSYNNAKQNSQKDTLKSMKDFIRTKDESLPTFKEYVEELKKRRESFSGFN